MNFTPHNWASHTLSCFPAPLQVLFTRAGISPQTRCIKTFSLSVSQAFFKQNNVPQESRFNLKKNVEEEYRKWKSMANENDIITHFSMQGSPPLFLCLLWKMLLETDHINQIGFRYRRAFALKHVFIRHRDRRRVTFNVFPLMSRRCVKANWPENA